MYQTKVHDLFLHYVTEILEHGEFTRDYGVRQETVKIEKGSGMEQSSIIPLLKLTD